jgi:hypothetical protein
VRFLRLPGARVAVAVEALVVRPRDPRGELEAIRPRPRQDATADLCAQLYGAAFGLVSGPLV